MCSVAEGELDGLDTLPGPELLSQPLEALCRKCGADEALVVLRRRDVYCGACFATAASHKFRAALGRSRLVPTGARVVLALSCGLSSSVLLHLVHAGVTEESHKKLRIAPLCIYVDDPTDGNAETRWKNCEFLVAQCKLNSLELYIVSIADSLNEKSTIFGPNIIPPINKERDDKFCAFVSSVSSETARNDLIVKTRRSLLIRYANILECGFIITAEASTTLACTMLSNIALGRGAQIESDIGFCDSRDDVRILKPMKELTYEEVKYFADLKQIPYITSHSGANKCDSIQSVIHKFVVELQYNFPATISTICKTGEKMGDSSQVSRRTEDTCVLCQSALDTQDMKSSALQATEFSRLVSSTGPQHAINEPVNCNGTGPSKNCSGCSCKKQTISRQEIEQHLCYGCRLIVREIKDADMPPHISYAVKTKMSISKLRDEINDYLI